jgi:predicted secreted protein
MNLEQIKHDKVKEAEKLFTELGIDYAQEQAIRRYFDEFLTSQPIVNKEEQDKKNKLIWTRLSINSNIGCIVE